MTIPSQDLMIRCTVCKTEKPLNEMTMNTQKGKEKQCKSCLAKYSREYREKNREKNNEYHREWRKNLGDDYRKQCVDRRQRNIEEMTPGQLCEFRENENNKAKRLYAKLRDEVFSVYGNKCACCGETEKLFLSLDHVKNDGAELKRSGIHGKSANDFYRYVKKLGFPPDYQILCMNCNTGKHRNGGICPHQVRCND